VHGRQQHRLISEYLPIERRAIVKFADDSSRIYREGAKKKKHRANSLIMKYLRLFVFISALMTLPSACQKDVLDVSPQGQLAEGSLSSASVVDKLVVAAYQGLGAHFFGNDEAFAGPSTNWIIDVRSDDAYKGGGGINDRSDIHQLETAAMDATNFAVAQKWRNPLFGISRCNYAIREINKLTSTTYPKAARVAEMRLLRGYFHHDLKRNFNQIPYLLEGTDPTLAKNTEHTSDELWALIEADYQAAFEALPPDNGAIGRVDKYTAAALLAKLYADRGQWAKVIPMCDFVQTGPFGLLQNYEDLSSLDYENGPESIFTVQFSTANNFANHNWSNLLNSTSSTGIASGGYANGDDFYVGSQNLANAFKTDANGLPLFDTFNSGQDVETSTYGGPLDPRLDHTMARIGIPFKGSAIYTADWIRSTDYYPGFSGKKHIVAPNDPNVHNSFPWAASGLNFQVIRYAEVLLWKAEALIELNQDLDQARTLVNQIRLRAKNGKYVRKLDNSGPAANYSINAYPAANWDQTYARKALRFERRLELAMEGNRFYDLLRWGNAAATINDFYQVEGTKRTYLVGSAFSAGKHEYLPIPQSEIDLAPDLYSQNQGY
jgi:starch-binding outer membrane protein, SusD/RagB family